MVIIIENVFKISDSIELRCHWPYGAVGRMRRIANCVVAENGAFCGGNVISKQ